MLNKLLIVVAAATVCVAHAQTIRYEATEMSIKDRPVVATGVELRGELNGGSVTEWNTLLSEDGWHTLNSGDASAKVLVLNGPKVEGGRLTENTEWSANRAQFGQGGVTFVKCVHVVRDDVIVPSGVTLRLAPGCIVKFLPGARIFVEGALNSLGAIFADFADDKVGGDTNFDADATVPSGIEWWMDDAAVSALAVVRFFDGATEIAPRRYYTLKRSYDELPVAEKNGWRFDGWFTEPASEGVKVTIGTTVTGSVNLYAHWQELSIELESDSVEMAAGAGVSSFGVTATGKWTVETDSSWVILEETSFLGNGTVAFSVTENLSMTARSATLRVVSEDGVSRDFMVLQAGLVAVATPVINPADGMTFSGSSRRVSISCQTADVAIYYTLDGSEPTEASKLYTKSFNVFDTTTVKAKAFKDDMLASDTVSSRIVRLQTLAEAINVPLWTVTTDSTHPWTVVVDESKDGTSAARSGEIGDNEESALEATVEGAGTLSFWWKVSCEDDPDADAWDYLAAFVDEIEVARIDGVVDWRQVTVKVKGEGAHTVRWVYCKDYMDDLIDVEDCGWVDQVSWTATVGDSSVPTSWVEGLGLVRAGESAASAANLDPDGDGFTTAEEYIIGTDPTDPNSKFTASIEMIDGKPVVTYEPDLLEERKYTTWGKKDLANPEENWQKVNAGDESDYNFFKMSVELPE